MQTIFCLNLVLIPIWLILALQSPTLPSKDQDLLKQWDLALLRDATVLIYFMIGALGIYFSLLSLYRETAWPLWVILTFFLCSTVEYCLGLFTELLHQDQQSP